MKSSATTHGGASRIRVTVATGVLCGLAIVPVAALSASATGSACATDDAVTREAAALGASLPTALTTPFSDGVLTVAEVAAAGYDVVCDGSGAVSFSATVASPTPSAIPTETPSATPTVTPTVAPTVEASASASASESTQAPAAVSPRSTGGSSRSTTTAPATATQPTAQPAPAAAPTQAASSPSPSASTIQNDELRTLAEAGTAGDEDAEALADPSLTAARGALPGIGIIAGVSAAAALALGGVAAVIGRTGGRRSPRHLR